MKVIVEIPCYNEKATLPAALRDLPQTWSSADGSECLVIGCGVAAPEHFSGVQAGIMARWKLGRAADVGHACLRRDQRLVGFHLRHRAAPFKMPGSDGSTTPAVAGDSHNADVLAVVAVLAPAASAISTT